METAKTIEREIKHSMDPIEILTLVEKAADDRGIEIDMDLQWWEIESKLEYEMVGDWDNDGKQELLNIIQLASDTLDQF